jgi:hypothetical protein
MSGDFGTMGSSLLAGLALGAMSPKPQMPQVPTAPPAPQASKVPDASTILAGLQGNNGQPGGGSASAGPTMLSGAGGVNPAGLPTVKKTLLGS